MNIKKTLRWIHRELGYLFATLTIIYAMSGIALNHRGDWNPDLEISQYKDSIPAQINIRDDSKDNAVDILKNLNIDYEYKKHYYPSDNVLKIFLNISGGNGSVTIDTEAGTYVVEKLERRFFFFPINQLHRNSFRKLWTWISDTFAVSLILLSITGVFMMQGKYGLLKHGIYLVVAGTILPLIFYLLYG